MRIEREEQKSIENERSPLHSSASVPFRWEEEPGKPWPCSALISFSNVNPPKSLELPPRLLFKMTSNCYASQTKPPGAASFASWTKNIFKLNKRHINPSSTLYHTNTPFCFWTSICDGFKQVVPWKSKKLKQDGSGISL
ncbi:uncharacterized protein LOC109795788 [Cajanus cajan]|uniref:Uncharacterized protein n=1 Tax=Cajanus cajan TaxID=3821 RepID=A0A151TY12_CAJCA|nr:uncharacterized protein LOC109795788 [Cajanus cajan]KYP71949.1 hypothetical protein KK1_011231 [Cajanus cajan]